MKEHPYWLTTEELIKGYPGRPMDGDILIIGSGFSGCSVAYHLQKMGMSTVMVDVGGRNASYYLNAGHILLGAGENYKTVIATKGRDKARELFSLSKKFCEKIYKEFIYSNPNSSDYVLGEYYMIPIDAPERTELQDSCNLLREDGIVTLHEDSNMFYCSLSAFANPVKIRNRMLNKACSSFTGTRHYEYYEVTKIEEVGGKVEVTYGNGTKSIHDAVVNCTNAYAPLISKQIEGKIVPFRGQILVSEPLPFFVSRFAFSSDHGSIYGQMTADNRLLIGGWRNKVEGMEMGDYELKSNPEITRGLNAFAKDRLPIPNNLKWDYCWTGIMGSARGAVPLVGPLPGHSLVYTCSGFTGYGFGWAWGSGEICAKIIAGKEIPKIAYEFRP